MLLLRVVTAVPATVAAWSSIPLASYRGSLPSRRYVACSAEKQSTDDSWSRKSYRISIVGAGVAGAVCAARLRQVLHSGTVPVHVRVYDMGSRGPGGRASSRPVDGLGGSFSPDDRGGGEAPQGDPLVFDHGVQAFAISDPSLEMLLTEWIRSGIVVEWHGAFGELDSRTGKFQRISEQWNGDSFCNLLASRTKYVGMPSMASFVRGMLQNVPCGAGDSLLRLDCRWNCKVEHIDYHAADVNGRWALKSSDGDVQYCDALVCAGHAASFAAGVASRLPRNVSDNDFPEEIQSSLREVSYPDGVAPLYALMVAFAAPLGDMAPFDGAEVRGSDDVVWISRDSSKPGRHRTDGKELWVVLSSEHFAKRMRHRPSWSRRPTEEHLQEVASELFAALATALHAELPDPVYMHAQRWAAGLTKTPLGLAPPCIRWPKAGLVTCGDWCATRVSVQDAALSGTAAAEAVHDIIVAAQPMCSLISVTTPSAAAAEAATAWPVWSCAAWPDPAGQFQESEWWTAREGAIEERCLIIEGRATLFLDGGAAPLTICKGDWVVFRKGFSCIWKVEEPISKHYNYFDSDGQEWAAPSE